MSPELLKVTERASREPNGRILSLAYLLDVAALRRVFDRARKNAAVGVDGVTKEQYGRDLEARLADLHERLKSQRYRHQPIRRVVPLVSPWKGRETGVGWEGDRREIGAKLRLPHEPIETTHYSPRGVTEIWTTICQQQPSDISS